METFNNKNHIKLPQIFTIPLPRNMAIWNFYKTFIAITRLTVRAFNGPFNNGPTLNAFMLTIANIPLALTT